MVHLCGEIVLEIVSANPLESLAFCKLEST